jgi:predicted GH43/DUF377 family glycosyl hydrolase
MASHAQVPRPLVLDDSIRIYFATRGQPDGAGQFVSRIGFIDVARDDPRHVLAVSKRPALDAGGLGSFDAFGVMPAYALRRGNEIWMYYTGWNRCIDVPYTTAIGLAVSGDEGVTFQRRSVGPLLGRTPDEPYLCNGPWLLRVGETWHMWYASATAWLATDDKPECRYVIMHAESDDLLHWRRDGRGCVPTVLPEECQNAPAVLEVDGRYHMWFCYRQAIDFRNADRGYRLAHASSDDLATWRRQDGPLASLGSRGTWDAEMQCYPAVLDLDGQRYLFYCGNHFGRDGFGVVSLEWIPNTPRTLTTSQQGVCVT